MGRWPCGWSYLEKKKNHDKKSPPYLRTDIISYLNPSSHFRHTASSVLPAERVVIENILKTRTSTLATRVCQDVQGQPRYLRDLLHPDVSGDLGFVSAISVGIATAQYANKRNFVLAAMSFHSVSLLSSSLLTHLLLLLCSVPYNASFGAACADTSLSMTHIQRKVSTPPLQAIIYTFCRDSLHTVLVPECNGQL